MDRSDKQAPAGSWFPRILAVILALAILFALLPAPLGVVPAQAATCEPTYEVRRGDTLSKIGQRFGVDPNQVVLLNNWNKPYTIYVGQKICIPTSSLSGAPKLENTQLNAPAVHFTAGRSGDTLMIYAYNYPKTNVLVRVQNANNPLKKLVNLGTISQITNGKTYRFKLTQDLQSASRLVVCLKDRTTSYLQCAIPRTGP